MKSYKVAITGGIGSGKSAACRSFERHGIPTVDSDQVAHDLTGPDGAAIPAIRTEFGESYIQPNGSMNRSKMRDEIFRNPMLKERLEAILHPLIRLETDRRANALTAPYVLIGVPLLAETLRRDPTQRARFVRILAVDCTVEQQVRRVMERSQMSEAQVRAIIAQQASREDRLAIADEVIPNHASLTELDRQVDRVHAKLLTELTGHPR